MPEEFRFGNLLRWFLYGSILSLDELAAYLHVEASQIIAWEEGNSIPPLDPDLFARFREVPGFTEADFLVFLQAAARDRFAEDFASFFSQTDIRDDRSQVISIPLISNMIVQTVFAATMKHEEFPYRDIITIYLRSLRPLNRPISITTEIRPLIDLTKSSYNDVNIILNPEKGADSALVDLKENPIPIQYPHTSVPDHAPRIVDEGRPKLPKKGVIIDFEQAKLLIEALETPNHEYRQAAEQAVRGFTENVEKPKGLSLNAAAQEFNVPNSFLWRWSKQRRVIPIVAEGKGKGSATFLDREKVREVSELYHEAKRQGKQPKKLLEQKYPETSKVPPIGMGEQQTESRPQTSQGISTNSAAQEFNVPQSFLWRWAKAGLIPIIEEGKGSGSATYLDREKVVEVVEVYYEAKRQGIQPIKLLQKMYPSIVEVPASPK